MATSSKAMSFDEDLLDDDEIANVLNQMDMEGNSADVEALLSEFIRYFMQICMATAIKYGTLKLCVLMDFCPTASRISYVVTFLGMNLKP